MPNFLAVAGGTDSIKDHYKEVRYMPPEMLLDTINDEDKVCDQKSIDIWLAGVALYMLLTKEYPFDDHSLPKCHMQLLQNTPKLEAIKNMQIRQLLQSLLEKDPHKRPKPDEILNHPLLLQLT